MALVAGALVLLIILLLSRRAKVAGKSSKQFGIERDSEKGEKVQSYGVKQIEDFFVKNNIKYVYESKTRWLYARPDFFLPEYNVYVEYWELDDLDDPILKSHYVKSMRRKMTQYYLKDLKFISIYPDNLNNLDRIFRKKLSQLLVKD